MIIVVLVVVVIVFLILKTSKKDRNAIGGSVESTKVSFIIILIWFELMRSVFL